MNSWCSSSKYLYGIGLFMPLLHEILVDARIHLLKSGFIGKLSNGREGVVAPNVTMAEKIHREAPFIFMFLL